MAIIAPHLRPGGWRSETDQHTLICAWPEDCRVQWGSSGVVLSEEGNRQTAFFEAFPNGPGFFRGEGASISDAEKDCFEKFSRFTVCDHI